MGLLYLSLVFLLLAILLFRQSHRLQEQSGLPGGRVIYSDTRSWGTLEKPLYDASLGLTGRPDYLVEVHGQVIPVEVKTGRHLLAPYDSHIFQLAAYCLLTERTYHQRPPYGIIHYSDQDFAVDYTPQLEAALLDLLAAMRRDERRRKVVRSHEEPARCARCGFRDQCDQRL